MTFSEEDRNKPGIETKMEGENAGSNIVQSETFGDRLKELIQKPRRNPVIHWAALVLSIVSLAPLIIWRIWPANFTESNWYAWDIGFSLFFMLEYITRSGFRWDPAGYTKTHFFDFIAIIPALVLIHFSIPWFVVWFWIILVARVMRAIDRILGDGFIARNLLTIAEGFEEELTDRVTLRILRRTREDLSRGKFGVAIGQAIEDNKMAVLKEIRTQHPHVLENGVVRFSGITRVLERAEENVYDAIVKVLKSPEIEKAIRHSVNTTFASIEMQVAQKSWKKNLGFKRQEQNLEGREVVAKSRK
jgi:hypothetical protein